MSAYLGSDRVEIWASRNFRSRSSALNIYELNPAANPWKRMYVVSVDNDQAKISLVHPHRHGGWDRIWGMGGCGVSEGLDHSPHVSDGVSHDGESTVESVAITGLNPSAVDGSADQFHRDPLLCLRHRQAILLRSASDPIGVIVDLAIAHQWYDDLMDWICARQSQCGGPDDSGGVDSRIHCHTVLC